MIAPMGLKLKTMGLKLKIYLRAAVKTMIFTAGGFGFYYVLVNLGLISPIPPLALVVIWIFGLAIELAYEIEKIKAKLDLP